MVLQLYRTHGHHGGNGVLVDELNLTVAPQQHAEIIEPGNVALQFHAIDQIDRHRRLALADGVQKGVLEILRLVVHGWTPLLVGDGRSMRRTTRGSAYKRSTRLRS